MLLWFVCVCACVYIGCLWSSAGSMYGVSITENHVLILSGVFECPGSLEALAVTQGTQRHAVTVDI